ncbi:MAG: hypothetical protein WBV79_04395, partial [Rhodomicrobium sp.]
INVPSMRSGGSGTDQAGLDGSTHLSADCLADGVCYQWQALCMVFAARAKLFSQTTIRSPL